MPVIVPLCSRSIVSPGPRTVGPTRYKSFGTPFSNEIIAPCNDPTTAGSSDRWNRLV